MDALIQCHACHQSATDPCELTCKHTYCSKCLNEKLVGNKLTCLVCNTEYITPNSSIKEISTPDKLTPYLLGVQSYEPYANIAGATPSIQAQCFECKLQGDLRTCFHCNKALCSACRTKHYQIQKKEVEESYRDLDTKISRAVELAITLNNSRETRLKTYAIMKEKIQHNVQVLKKYIDDEAERLQKQVDNRVALEEEKIRVAKQEEVHLKNHKSALDTVIDKSKHESDHMTASKMFIDYVQVAPNWKSKIESQAGRLNPEKELELHYHFEMPKKDDAILGTIKDTKSTDIQASSEAKKMAKQADNKSSTCIIV
ncbi:unnamed protein product [Didymodactylos carnosus]|uniref:RING-type domain-containing protein n=1 Tax=Didymodactylos carnosus TaxID=1234261 RepID=A0A814HL91_9BILA|nr:unnamed protein product [Didymodactylos carnosus]CAF3782726.1 unnamed protein product [Didymodactylos carnosus]